MKTRALRQNGADASGEIDRTRGAIDRDFDGVVPEPEAEWPVVAAITSVALDRNTQQNPPDGIMEEAVSPHISIDRDAVAAFCRRHYITRLALFGSVLRDDFRPDSDVDVLVEFQPGHVPGLDFVSIECEFSGLLQGRRVDMVTPKFLNRRIREQVLTSAEPLYVAA
jgi:predicted nucleotidyltransferase